MLLNIMIILEIETGASVLVKGTNKITSSGLTQNPDIRVEFCF